MGYFSPILLMELYVEFEEGLMNYIIGLLKTSRTLQVRIGKSRLFHLITEEEKKVVFTEIMIKTKRKYIGGLPCLITSAAFG